MGRGQIGYWGISTIDTVAERKRVVWRPKTAATVAKVGQPVSYNSDITADWKELTINRLTGDFGGENATAYAEGAQAYNGRFLIVEEVSVDEPSAFAGIIAVLGSKKGADGDIIEIYIPNGAVVPVYTDKNIVRLDRLYLEDGEQTFVNATQAGMGPCVGIAYETVDRSSTAGLVWAKIVHPGFGDIYDGTLGVGYSENLWRDCPWDEIVKNPGLGIVYADDFMGMANTVTTEGWTITNTTTGTLSLVAAEGGELKFDSAGNTTSDDGTEAQLLNCRFLPAAGKTIWFEARIKMNDATDLYFIGLAATDTTLMAAGVLDDVVDKCGFYHEAAGTDNKISSVTARAAADDKTADVAGNTDATYMTVGFRITGLTSVEFYVNGVLVETGVTAANIPNVAMCLSGVSKIEVAGADAELSVDWVRIAQLGARA